MPEATPPRPGRHRADLRRTRSSGQHRAPRRRQSHRGVVVAVTAGVLTTGTTLALEWPVTGSAADPVASTDVVPAAGNSPGPAEERDGRAADRPAYEKQSGSPARPAAGGDRDGSRDRVGVSRSGERVDVAPPEPAWLAGCGPGQDIDSHPNGALPDDELCALPAEGHRLRPAAARAWWRLNAAYEEEFGTSMCITDSYRSFEQQEALALTKPGLAAQPGTSNHGWASALDLCGGAESFGTAQHEWLRVQAPALGWENPSWAQAEGSKPEAWHWEYVEQG